ncbi:PEP/pyruvate-binding domain-containing protein [Nocardia carnea]|uniref:PEP/pyruvate-binding domain-containing protein n=1 Tax=Nocardia carnea TaxID=37328 RepID=A0ABW7TJ97_9NOCA|nr:PEP/pyruvate-binding domain-containing protein [Nocardia carnea]
MRVLGVDDAEADIVAWGGGKARGLYALGVAGARVPAWLVLSTDVFAEFAAAAGLVSRIDGLARADDLDTALELAGGIRADIAAAGAVFDEAGIRDVVRAAHTRLGGGALAVRSSVVGEDGATDSFAGLFDSYLNIGSDEVCERVRDCWASGFSDRVVRYAFARNRRPVTEIAVLLQRFVAAHASGVLFTRNPASGSVGEVVVSAVYGLGDGLVSGAVDADTVVVDESGAVVERTVGDKDVEYVPASGRGLAVVDVPEPRRTASVLGDEEAALLADRGRGLADALGGPQDFEWAVDGDGLWFLQARPITGVHPLPDSPDRPDTGGGHRGLHLVQNGPAGAAVLRGAGEPVAPGAVRIWDNSNIIESFQGLTSPLTFTVAAGIYGRVYRGYAQSLGVPENQLRQLDSWTPYLLGTFHGRVYYNLLHWYRMVGIAPGYPLNRKVLEAALGVAEPLPDEIAKTLRPFDFGNGVQRGWSRARTTAIYVRRIFGIDAMMREFCTEFYRVYDRYDAMEYRHGEHAYAAYRRVDRDLVLRWGPMMVLDAILLTLTGTMFLLTKAFLPQAPKSLLYALVGPGADIESAEPARAMTDLARRAHADPGLTALLSTTEPEHTYAALRAGGYRDYLAEIDNYLDRYGYRSVDELKLEAPDLREDPAGLFVLLRGALGRIGAPEPAGEPTLDPDAYLDEHLGGLRRLLYDRVRSKTARCAAHRERLRFCRTRAFGMVKRMIRVMGRDLAARGVIADFPDVFYLTVEELHNCYDRVPMPDLADRITARKIARTVDAELVAPARFTTVGPELTDAELAEQGWIPLAETPAAVPGDVLAGTPSAAGVVEGIAVLVDEPRDVAGGILVAYRTDPGWVAALPSASALVIERGSPLTHVAIVARELGVPTVVQVPGAGRKLRTGMRIRVDGAAGTVTVLSGGGHDDGTG